MASKATIPAPSCRTPGPANVKKQIEVMHYQHVIKLGRTPGPADGYKRNAKIAMVRGRHILSGEVDLAVCADRCAGLWGIGHLRPPRACKRKYNKWV